MAWLWHNILIELQCLSAARPHHANQPCVPMIVFAFPEAPGPVQVEIGVYLIARKIDGYRIEPHLVLFAKHHTAPLLLLLLPYVSGEWHRDAVL